MRSVLAMTGVSVLAITGMAVANDGTSSTTLNVDWGTSDTGVVATASMDLPAVDSITSMALDLSHTWVGDIEARVTAPGGAVFELMIDEDGSGDVGIVGNGFLSDVDTYTFIESGATGGPNGDGTFTTGLNVGGEYNANLWVAGGFAAGTWMLEIIDDAGGDGGAIGDWSIKYASVPAPGALALIGLAGLVGGRRRRD